MTDKLCEAAQHKGDSRKSYYLPYFLRQSLYHMPMKTRNAKHFFSNMSSMQLLINQKHFNMLCDLFIEASIEILEDGSGKTPDGKKVSQEDLSKLVARGYLQFVIAEDGLVFAGITPKTVRMLTYLMKLE
jgi:hypothetical protein